MVKSKELSDVSVAVLIPCYNEEKTVGLVVEGFQKELPDATIYVFDNNSIDKTAEVAQDAGAQVVPESRQGKGNVVRSMFRLIDADVYVMVDGDNTYSPRDAKAMIQPILSDVADMVVGDRLSSKLYEHENTRKFHNFGNQLVRSMINKLFGSDCKDILSGYRVFSRFFVCNFPVMTEGFEIETELTLYTLDKNFRLLELPINYKDRVEGSESKLSTFGDGYKILKTIGFVFKNYKPFVFFSTASAILAIVGLLIGYSPVMEYMKFHYVYRVPSAILAASIEILAALLFGCGLILDTIVRQEKEQFELRLTDFYKKNNKNK